jgi:hypothetical protein
MFEKETVRFCYRLITLIGKEGTYEERLATLISLMGDIPGAYSVTPFFKGLGNNDKEHDKLYIDFVDKFEDYALFSINEEEWLSTIALHESIEAAKSSQKILAVNGWS